VKRLVYAWLRALSALDRFLGDRLTKAGWLLLAAGSAAGAAGIDTGQTLTYQAFTFAAALLALAALASLPFRARVAIERDLPRYATAGERFDYALRVTNRGARALDGVTARERFRDARPGFEEWRRAREPGEEQRNWFDRNAGYFRWRWLIERRLPERPEEAPLPRLAPGEQASVRLSMTPRRRGRISLEGVTLGRADPLGLVRGLARVRLEARVTALPRRYRLPGLALSGRRKFQPGGVSLAASVGDSEEFLMLREYRPGDPLHRVHWKSFARAGKPVVKEFQDEFFERHALVLDTSTDRGEDQAFEAAVALAASFVCTLDTQECLLDLLFVGGEVRLYTAGRGQLHAEHMLEVLAGVSPSPPAEFEALARAVLAQRGRLSSCIAVLLGWDAPRQEFVRALGASGLDARALLLCDAEPAGLPHNVFPLVPGRIEQGLARLR
jgi:uncharacterized protein (DUF58 family)